MKVLLDACVLYPTVMREVLLGVAQAGLYKPYWSERILEEWVRAAARLGSDQEIIARAEVARICAQWPTASCRANKRDLQRIWLPDQNDIHVFASAIKAGADILLTMNNKDFPRHSLRDENVERASPDLFLCDMLAKDPTAVTGVCDRVLAEAIRLSNAPWTARSLMKKARLPRFGKAIERVTPSL